MYVYKYTHKWMYIIYIYIRIYIYVYVSIFTHIYICVYTQQCARAETGELTEGCDSEGDSPDLPVPACHLNNKIHTFTLATATVTTIVWFGKWACGRCYRV